MTKSRRQDRRQHRRLHMRVGALLVPLLILEVVPVVLLSSYFIGVGFPVTCVEALAAAKNKGRGLKSSGNAKGKGGFGGFGTPPQTLEDVLANVKTTRFPKDAPSLPCPCGSSKAGQEQTDKKTYAECCGPLLEEASHCGGCRTPLQVLQSRYTAFCFRNIGHVIRTTHKECRDYRDDKVAWAKDMDKEGMFDSFEFVELEIVDDDETVEATENNKNKSENEAFLEFRVRLKGRSVEEAPVRSRSLSSIEGEETVVSERSRFLRDPDSGIWKYAGGDVRSTVQGLEDTTLNA
jgi:SEC-C motif-containing protein